MRESNQKWLITYDDSPYIRKLYSFANIVPWSLVYGMKNVSENTENIGNELFIFNYDVNEKSVNEQFWVNQPILNFS